MLRGDIIEYEDNAFAVFTEQGTSASSMAASKFVDAIARFPGCSGEQSDAHKAYPQVRLSEAPELLGIPPEQFPKLYITLPRDRRPSWWDKIEDPVVELEANVYGHKIAGLLWEKFFESRAFTPGWERVPGWECLCVHRKRKVFLAA